MLSEGNMWEMFYSYSKIFVQYFGRSNNSILPANNSWGGLVSIVSDCELDDCGAIPGRGQRIFLLACVSIPAWWPTQPHIKWVPGSLPLGEKHKWGVMLTTYPIRAEVKNE
jgi:hypothetical protein